MIDFANVPKNEQEIIISIDRGAQIAIVYSSCRATCTRLLRNLTIKPERHMCKGKLTGLTFKIPLEDRNNLRKVIKMNLLLGKIS